ncbi:hypothetical protein B0A48_06108 [Cryoendolithus antarcticus]|uniref:K Homology domain-containing protein n=1 Tax=Cryoendolithus antarcticus TaxID=1507870 RepID=A0A1V8TCW6_9PEZI|nr:hypothetical protein B0A48_06108 [Cryoendolithus antarcticus]
MAQPDISQILAALAQQNQNSTPAQSAPQQPPPPRQYAPPQQQAAPPGSYLPQPTSSGSFDLNSIKPSGGGSVSIAAAIAKAKSIAADRGVNSYDPRAGTVDINGITYKHHIDAPTASPRDDPRLAGRGGGFRRSRSRSRSPPRRDYNSNPYRDERREDPRRGSFRRSPSPDRNQRGSRDPPSGYRANDGETETIQVKGSLVGLIIGRGGENLKRIEAESSARIQFLQPGSSHASERECTISGSTRARENAKAAIFGIIEENGGTNIAQPMVQDKGAYTAGMPGRAKVNLPALRDGENSVQIMVPDKTVGLIIGRGGETIKSLQERSGCHVNIVGENKSVNGLRPVNLIGSGASVNVAKELILEIVESDARGVPVGSLGSGSNSMPPARDRGFDGGRGGGGGDGGSISKTIQVPSESVGMIIGKGGETIKDLQRSSGCKINVHQPKPPDVTRDIDLDGTPRQMAEAERVIWEKVETVRQRDLAGGRGGGGGGGNRGGRGGSAGYEQQQQPRYDQYSQQQQQPAMPSYAQYMPQQQQAPAYQMPQQAAPVQQQQAGEQAQDPATAAAYAQYYAQWYAQQMQNLGQQGGQGGAPGT